MPNSRVPKRSVTPAEKDAIEITLQWLEERCVIDEDTGCWVWQGRICPKGSPQAGFTVATNACTTMQVRRLVAKMVLDGTPKLNGRDVNEYLRKRQVGVKPDCLRGCCCPDHVRARTKMQAAAETRGRGFSVSHRLAISRAMKKKISDQAIAEMMLSNEKNCEVAARLGVHPSYVGYVRNGKRRKHTVVGGVFSGLLIPTRGPFHDEEKAA